MALLRAALVGGTVGGVLFLLLLALAACVLWRRMRERVQYLQLLHLEPVVPACTTPFFLATQSSSHLSLKDIPFVVPRQFRSSLHAHLGEEQVRQEEREGKGPVNRHKHHGSLTIDSSFPLGSLRPDQYQIIEESGEWMSPPGKATQLCFSVDHRPEAEQLLVSVLRAVNLPPRYQSSTILVKIHLLPRGRRQHQSKAQDRGCQPHFRKSFVFQVSSSNLSQCILSLSLFSVDHLKKHQPLGRVLFPLKELNLRSSARRPLWRELEPEGDQPSSEHGGLQVSLNYNFPLQRLTVVVLRAQGLQLHSEAGVCVQVSLQIHTQVVKSKKTPTLMGGSNHTFNERMIFNLLPKQLDEACLSLELLQQTVVGLRSLGLVVIGPFMYARGQELEHWNDMVNKPRELVKQWHNLVPPTTASMLSAETATDNGTVQSPATS